MEDNKKQSVESEKDKEKGNMGRIESCTKKKQRLETTHTDLRKEAYQLAVDAEKKNKMDLLVKSNTNRSKANEEMIEFQTEEDKIKDLKDKLNKL